MQILRLSKRSAQGGSAFFGKIEEFFDNIFHLSASRIKGRRNKPEQAKSGKRGILRRRRQVKAVWKNIIKQKRQENAIGQTDQFHTKRASLRGDPFE